MESVCINACITISLWMQKLNFEAVYIFACLCFSVEGKVYKDGLCVLLCFNLARGHMAGTLSALSMLQGEKKV